MGFDHNFDEKIDVIDLIINVLKDHEKKLDELVSRLEEVQITPPEERLPREVEKPVGMRFTAILKKWIEFREKCSSAQLVAFDIEEGRFEVSAVAGGVLYLYREEIPRMDIRYREGVHGAEIEGVDISKVGLMPTALRGKLDCGLEFSRKDVEVRMPDERIVHKVLYDIDAGTAKSWITYQLGIDDSKIVQGRLQS